MIQTSVDKESSKERFLVNGKVTFDVITSELSDDFQTVKLAYTDAKTLHLLISNLGDVIARDIIIDFSWKGRVVTDSSLAKSISNLRKVFRNFGLNDESIITVPRIGYKLVCSVIKLVDNEEPTNMAIDSSIPGEIQSNNYIFPLEISNADINSINDDSHLKKINLLYVSLKNIIFCLCLASIPISIYNAIEKKSFISSNEYINKGYEIVDVNTAGRMVKVLKKKGVTLSSDIYEVISLSPQDATVFINQTNGFYNLSYYTDDGSVSIRVKVEDLTKAKIKIKEILSRGVSECGM